MICNNDGTGQQVIETCAISYTIAFHRLTADSDNLTNANIFVMKVDTPGSETKLMEGMNPIWSPDGSKIAFLKNKDGLGLQLYVMQANGTGEKNLMNGSDSVSDTWNPSWSPDGTRLVFVGDEGEVYTVNSDGTGLLKITSGARATDTGGLAWSPK